MKIRITDIPGGEAPLEIRRAWVGLVLPLAPGEDGPRTPRTAGVLSGPKRLLTLHQKRDRCVSIVWAQFRIQRLMALLPARDC